jgi:hypothetical protein
MIYMIGENHAIVVLETKNLEKIKQGQPAVTPDGKICIAWTPDPVWLADKIRNANGDAQKISKLVDEAAKRPQKPDRPRHDTHITNLKGKTS